MFRGGGGRNETQKGVERALALIPPAVAADTYKPTRNFIGGPATPATANTTCSKRTNAGLGGTAGFSPGRIAKSV